MALLVPPSASLSYMCMPRYYFMNIKFCWAPHLVMSPVHFAMASTALFSAFEQTHCALVYAALNESWLYFAQSVFVEVYPRKLCTDSVVSLSRGWFVMCAPPPPSLSVCQKRKKEKRKKKACFVVVLLAAQMCERGRWDAINIKSQRLDRL